MREGRCRRFSGRVWQGWTTAVATCISGRPLLSSNATASHYGALFGFFAYGTYDFTNLATLKGWSELITFVDLAWGTLLTGVSAALGYLIASAIVRI